MRNRDSEGAASRIAAPCHRGRLPPEIAATTRRGRNRNPALLEYGAIAAGIALILLAVAL
jgi:hypothetical protein